MACNCSDCARLRAELREMEGHAQEAHQSRIELSEEAASLRAEVERLRGLLRRWMHADNWDSHVEFMLRLAKDTRAALAGEPKDLGDPAPPTVCPKCGWEWGAPDDGEPEFYDKGTPTENVMVAVPCPDCGGKEASDDS